MIAAAGDIACDPANPAFRGGVGTSSACRQVYTGNQLEAGGFASVLPLGDEQYECGGAAAFTQSYDPAWGAPAVKAITRPAVGNHEYDTTGGTDCGTGAAGYFSYFGAAAGEAGKGWYSHDVGAWHLIALNSNCAKVSCAAGSEQEQWLAQDLAQHSNTCTLAYFHHPAFSAGSTSGSINDKVLPFWNDLYGAGADLVLNGHKHNYQRLSQLDASGNPDPTNGIREIIAGVGGVNLGSQATPYPGTEFRDSSDFGILEVTLHPTSYDWRFVSEAGAVIDSGSDDCVAAPAPPAPTITSFTPTSGAVGDNVTITGTNFTGATSVTFNGTSATYTVTNDTTISATVPAGATTGPIAVTTPGGTATSSTNFTVTSTPPPAPTITSFTPTSGAVGDNVTITGTNFTGATSVTFNGTSATYTVTNDTTISATVPAGATTGPIAVTTPGGTATSSTNFTVTSTPPPAPTLVQHILAKGGSTTGPTATWQQATVSGDLLVAAIGWTGSGTPTAPAGWTLARKAGGTAIFYMQNASSQSGAVTFGGKGIGSWVLELMEWSGAATTSALDKTASATSGTTETTTASSGTTATTSQASEIAIGTIRALKALTQSSPSNGFAQLDVGTQGTNTTGVYTKVLTATAPQNVSVTLSLAAKWRGVIATFRGI